MSAGSAACARIVPERSATATSMLVAPMSATSRYPASPRKRRAGEVAFREELPVEQRSEPLRDAHAAEAGCLGERRSRGGSMPAHVIEHLDESRGAVPTVH
jgi:hypothetical protein